jgi:hypothetical protein
MKAAPTDLRALHAAMLSQNVSVTDLVRKTGFLRHQVLAAIAGEAKISEATYSVLLRACHAAAEDRRPHPTE